MGDRLLGTIDLASSTHANSGSPRLKQAAIEQNARALEGTDFFHLLPQKPFSYRILLPGICLFLSGLTAGIAPEAAGNAWLRWLHPLHPPERFTFTVLEDSPARLIVAQGESWPLSFRLSPGSSHQPETAQFRLDGGKWAEVKRTPGNDSYKLTIPPLQRAARLDFSVGDTRRRMKIIPQSRPGMERAEALIIPPSYTGRSSYMEPMKAGAIPVPEGGKATIRATATRILGKASAQPSGHPVRIEGNTAIIPDILMDKELQEWELSWTDINGLESSSPRHLTLTPIEDMPPRILLHESIGNKFILENTTVQIDIEATDDYGIREAGLSWIGEKSLGDQQKEGTEKVLKTGSPTMPKVEGSMVFRARDLGIAPQRVVIRAFASDYAPDGKKVYSEPLILYILSPERHAEMIRHSLERLSGSLEELSRSMDSISDESKRLLHLDERELTSPETRKRLQGLAQQEQTGRRQLGNIVRQGEAIFREATLNTQIDPDGMRRLMESLQKMSPLPTGAMRDAQKNFEQSADPSNRDSTSGPLRQADVKHELAARIIKEATVAMNTAAQSMEAGTFVARLRYLAGMEESVSRSLASYLQHTVGLAPDELSPSSRRSMEAINALQKANTRDMNWLLEDLGSYRQRTTLPIYGDLYEIMQSSEIVRRMENISEYIAAAQSGIGIEHALLVARSLERWARLLDDNKKKSTPGGGLGGMNNSNEEDISQSAFELLLKIMHIIRKQEDIRIRTRAMEQTRREHPNAPLDSTILADEQDELQADVMDIVSEQTDRETITLLEQCRHAMNDAVDELEGGRTGNVAIAAQTEVIELIYQAASRMNSGSQSGSGSTTLMNMIRQMLGMEADSTHKETSPYSSPGSGTGGAGSSTPDNLPDEKSDQTPIHKTRTVPKSTGSGATDMPEEFRRALDAYNKTLQG